LNDQREKVREIKETGKEHERTALEFGRKTRRKRGEIKPLPLLERRCNPATNYQRKKIPDHKNTL